MNLKLVQVPNCHRELPGVLLKECITLLLGEEAPWKVSVTALNRQTAAKRKELGDSRRTTVSPCQVVWPHSA